MADETRTPGLPWERYRAYLHLLARLQMPSPLRAKVDPSDLVQQTLLEAHQVAERLGEMDEAGRVAFLRRVLANNFVDLARRFAAEGRDIGRERSVEAQLHESSVRLAGFLAAAQTSPSQQVVREEELLSLAVMLAELPEDQRLAVEMKHLQGHPVAAIAETMGRSETAVGGLLRRGLKRLRELMRTVE